MTQTVDPKLFEAFGATPTTTADDDETTLAYLDPGRDIVLELCKAALLAELTPPWEDAAAGTPLQERAVVQTHRPQEPDDQLLRSDKVLFPALFVYWSVDHDIEVHQRSIEQLERVRVMGLDYILGPLGTFERRKVGDVLTLAHEKLTFVFARGGHPAYLSQTLAGGRKHLLNVLVTPEYCGFSSVSVLKSRIGVASFAEDSPKYWALSMEIQVGELSKRTSNGSPYQGASLSLSTGNSEGLVQDIALARTPHREGE